MGVAAHGKGVDEGRCSALSWERKRESEGGERGDAKVAVWIGVENRRKRVERRAGLVRATILP